jgi:uncharacterized protein (DUF1015 family)
VAEIIPFRGYRYDTRAVENLGKVIAPPYDVIDAPLRDTLFRLSPYNIAHITKADRVENSSGGPYAAAGLLWARWREQGIVKQDDQPCLYVYEQFFEVHGRPFSRTALGCALRLEPFDGGVRPHEDTLAGPRMDRLELTRATRAQFGQVFGLYNDPSGAVARLIEPIKKGRPIALAADRQDLLHRLWMISDPALIAALQKALRDRDILIADGHHRYESSLAFSQEHPNVQPAQYRMMALVDASSVGLVILPIHRLVKGLRDFDPERFTAGLRRAFEIKLYPGDTPAVRSAVLDAIRELKEEGRHAFGLDLGDKNHRLLILRREELMDARQDHSRAWRRLDVSILHRLILEEHMGITPARLEAESNVEYIQDFPHAVQPAADRVRARECQALFLMNPTSVAEVQAVADQRERMPQKSTFFYPKVYTGMVFYAMDA